jgi:hypothetical protein
MFDATFLGFGLMILGLGMLVVWQLIRMHHKYLFSVLYTQALAHPNYPILYHSSPTQPMNDLSASLNAESLDFHVPTTQYGHYMYAKHAHLLTSEEKTLFIALDQIFATENYRILAKVRLSEILKPDHSLALNERRAATERLLHKCLDFVVCEKESFAVIGVIKLLKSSQRLDTQIRARFVNLALQTAQIPILELFIQNRYELSTLRDSLNKAFELNLNVPVKCPKCGSSLVNARVKQGKWAGKMVLACPHYPRCKTVIPESEIMG